MNVCRWILRTGVAPLIAIGFLAVFSDFVVYGQTVSSTSTVTDNRSTSHIFAQVADGQFGDGSSYRSTLVVQSDNSTAVSCTATLVGLTIPGFGDGQSLAISLLIVASDISGKEVSRATVPAGQADVLDFKPQNRRRQNCPTGHDCSNLL